MADMNNPRWDPYFMKHGDQFHGFWESYLADRDRSILYVLGQGFDPRMCDGFEGIIGAAGQGSRDCLLLTFDDELDDVQSSQRERITEANLRKLEKLLIPHNRMETTDGCIAT